MPTQTQISTRILRGRIYQANLVKSNVIQANAGNTLTDWSLPLYLSNLVQGLQFQYSLPDYTSNTTLSIYNKLGIALGGKYVDGSSLNPNFQPPNSSGVIITNTYIGNNVIQGKIPFTNASPLTLANYNTVYKPIYGNNLITLQVYLTGYTEDEQTPPTITYATPNDPTTDIMSITWSYPIPVSGYILIAGVQPVTGTPVGGGGATTLNFTEGNLLQDGNGSWYLPLTLTAGQVVFYTQSNGVSVSTTFDETYTPNRLYGFASNVAQSIIVKVI